MKPRGRKLYQLLPITVLSAGLLIIGLYAAQLPSSSPHLKGEATTRKSYKAGLTTKEVTVDGLRRTYDIYVPPGITADRLVPLITLFHGAGADSAAMAELSGFNTLADREKIIVAYLNGTTDEQRGETDIPEDQQYRGRIWHSGRTFTPHIGRINDNKFAKEVIETTKRELSVDDAAIFAAGFSNGGSLAYRFACETDIFTAVAAVGSALEIPSCDGVKPTSVLSIHGSDDTTYEPGFVRGQLEAKRSVADSNRMVAEAYGCQREQSDQYASLQARGFRECRGGIRIDIIKIPDVGHTWTSDMTEAIWHFFRSAATRRR